MLIICDYSSRNPHTSIHKRRLLAEIRAYNIDMNQCCCERVVVELVVSSGIFEGQDAYFSVMVACARCANNGG